MIGFHPGAEFVYSFRSRFDHEQQFRVLLDFPFPFVHGSESRDDVDASGEFGRDQTGR